MQITERLLRASLTGSLKPLIFNKPSGIASFFPYPAGLYLHIPLCKNCCPFCPYVKEAYSEEKSDLLFQSVKREIGVFSQKHSSINTTSLYIGGGSPLLLGSRLGDLVDCFSSHLNFKGPVAVEVYPGDINDNGIENLIKCKTSMVSLGAQSFDDGILNHIQRRHSSKTAVSALVNLSKAGFSSINVDLLFAIQGQTWMSVEYDLKCARDSGATQITCYPLFTFPFTETGRYLNLNKVKLPPFAIRKDIYYRIHDWCLQNGFQRTSVWSFTLPGANPFSSVTREYFAGFGPSAGSYNGSRFSFNTFSINEYSNKVNHGILPVALELDVNPVIQRLFWTYWRFYQTHFDTVVYDNKFGRHFKKDFRIPLLLLTLLKWIENDSGSYLRLTKKGSHWLHLLQNIVALDYTSRIWEHLKQCAWPVKIKL
jgi:oxygen-independent coproporphyrinogen-3 oxidase